MRDFLVDRLGCWAGSSVFSARPLLATSMPGLKCGLGSGPHAALSFGKDQLSGCARCAAVTDFGFEFGQASDEAFALVVVGKPADDVRGDLERFIFVGQILGEQDAVGVGIGGTVGCVVGRKEFFGREQINEGDVLHAAEESLDAISDGTDPVQDDGRLFVIQQLQRDGAGTGEAAFGQVNELGGFANVDFGGDFALLDEFTSKFRLMRLVRGHGETDLGEAGLD